MLALVLPVNWSVPPLMTRLLALVGLDFPRGLAVVVSPLAINVGTLVMPALRYTLPVNVLAPLRISVPGPDFTRGMLPVMAALMVKVLAGSNCCTTSSLLAVKLPPVMIEALLATLGVIRMPPDWIVLVPVPERLTVSADALLNWRLLVVAPLAGNPLSRDDGRVVAGAPRVVGKGGQAGDVAAADGPGRAPPKVQGIAAEDGSWWSRWWW